MNVIANEIEAAIDKELQSAQKRFGLHHSWHEKYGVTLEELQECEEEIDFMRKFLDQAFGDIRSEQPEKTDKFFKLTEKHAIRCAIEAIQCAAMCRKEIDERADNGTAEISDHGTYTGKDDVRVLRCDACRNDFVSTIRPHPYFCPKCGAEFTNILRF